MVIAHETAHSWIGDLVSAERFGLVFIHESLASFYQYRVLEVVFEEEKGFMVRV
jgi:aminopeptidase N